MHGLHSDRKWWWLISVPLVLSVGVLSFCFSLGIGKRVTPSVEIQRVQNPHHATLMDGAFYQPAFTHPAAVTSINQTVQGIILPHHLLASPLIAGALQEIARVTHPTSILLLGPDHLGRNPRGISMVCDGWKTPFGNVVVDERRISLAQTLGIACDDHLADEDHALSALTPFLAKYFPAVPVAGFHISTRFSVQDISRLQELVAADANTLVIASVDFSHFQYDSVAWLHDQQSIATLGYASSTMIQNLEVDSPKTLDAFLTLMEDMHAQKMTLLAESTSAHIADRPSPNETTSYVLAAFSSGEAAPASTNAVTLVAMGDLMFDRNVKVRMDAHPADWIFSALAGPEQRFFRGVDIITANLEGAIAPRRAPEKSIDFAFPTSTASLLASTGFSAVSLANNHGLDQGRQGYEETKAALDAASVGWFGDPGRENGAPWTTVIRGKKVTFLGFNSVDHPFDDMKALLAIREAKKDADIVISFLHWGAEYQHLPTDSQRAFGRAMIEAGADVVIGAHPHVIEGMEVWNGKPIFWSLGNAVFDQDWSQQTQEGMAIGLVMKEKQTDIVLLPLLIHQSQPSLALDADRARLLKAFADRSTLSSTLTQEVASGTVSITNP